MAYASWSVSFGEQPSAAKWNILGTNDAAFNNGTGLPSANASSSTVATSETTTSTTYAALATAQSFSVTIGSTGLLLVGLAANMSNNTAAAFAEMSFALSGANTLAASDANAIRYQSISANEEGRFGITKLIGSLSTGSTTVTAQFSVQTGGSGSGTGTFSNRHIWAVPL